ncbi:MAG: DegT/DnrJ/EryC1/StrS family aminotransferase [Rhodospirillaceae bacterium]|nr:DegT/DnrJ/EryC1/StrS family aminotransferase [Rhodospirillales bacterium]
MITTAPLPMGLLAGVWRHASPDQATAPWRRNGDDALMLSRSAWSLAALAQVIATERGHAARVLLPAWFCGQSLLPLRAAGAQLSFVPVDAHGVPQWPAHGDADMIVAVHSFGCPTDLSAAVALRARTGALLIEDCAHVLHPAPGMGEVGDAVLYSPHKTLGLPEGAVLVTRQPGLSDRLRAVLGDLPPAPSPARWAAKRMVQRLIPDSLRPRLPMGGPPDFLADPPVGEAAPLTGASALSLSLMAGACMATQAAARQRNATALRTALAGLPGWAPFFAHDGPAPYRFALLCDDAGVAETRYARLRQFHLPVESWPDMVPEVAASPKEFGHALDLRRRIVLLPVHASLPAGYEHAYAEALHAG